MADLGNQKIKDTYQLVLQTDTSGNLQKLDGSTPNPFIVNGNLRYLDGSSHPSGYVLISDGSGNASWGSVAFSGDVYISGGSIDDTVITLQTTSGNSISIPGLAWSARTDGSVSPSGATTDVRISGDTYTNDLYLGGNVEISGNAYITGNTFYEGALSGTGSITTTSSVKGEHIQSTDDMSVPDGGKYILDDIGGDTYITNGGTNNNVELHASNNLLLTVNPTNGLFTNGLAISGTNITATANIDVAGDIIHLADEDNKIVFGTDTQDYQTGGSSRLDISDSGVRLGGANSRVTTILDEDNMASDSDTSLATQQSIKAYVDSQVAGSDTLQEVTDNGATTTNAIQLGSNLGISGNTFFEGALSGTGNITTTANITAIGNLTTTGGIRTNTDDFVVNVTNTPYKQVGVNTNVPDANLTISGTNGFSAYDMNGGTAQFSEGFDRVLFSSGANTSGLEAGDLLAVTDGSGDGYIVTIQTVPDTANIFLTSAFPGTGVIATSFTYNGLEPTPLRVYNNTTLAFEVDGDNTFYGGALSGTGDITTTGNLFVSGNTFYEGALSGTGNITTVGDVFATNITASNNLYISGDTHHEGAFSATGNITTSKNLYVSGDTFYEGALSGTGSITTTEDIAGTNITTSNNLYITGNTFYEGSISGRSDIQISDAGKLKLGDAGDLEIYHNGSNSFIDDAGTGTIFYRSGTQTFQNAAGSKTMAVFNGATSVDLHYDNNKKFETTDTGVLITGDGKATTLTSTSNLYITGNTFYEGALSGTGSITTTDKVFISGDTYAPNFQNGTTIIQCSFSLKTFSTNNWASHPVSQGGLNSEFWTQDTGVSDLSGLYAFYNTANPTAGNPSPSQGSFCAPATGKLRKIVFNGANSTGALKGDDLEIEIAKAPVTDGQSGLTYTQLSGITHTLPDNTAKRFIIDCAFGGEGVDVTANDVILVAFKTTESSNAFIRINLSAYFEYPLPLIT